MESANSHHHHQLQDHVVGSSSSSATPYYGVGTTTHAWSTTPSFSNINNGFTSYPSEPILLHSRDSRHQENTLLSSQYISNMAPDLGFHNWAANTTPDFTTNPSVQAEQLSRIKAEFSDHYYQGKYTNLLTSNHQHSSNTNDEQSLRTNERRINLLQPNDFFTMKKNINRISPRDLLYSGGFGQIFPSMNASNMNNQMGLTNDAGGCNLDMNLEALDLLTSSSFSGNLGTCSPNQIGILRDGFSNNYNGAFDDRMQQSHQIPLYGSNEIRASISNGDVEAKRSSTRMEVKSPPPLQNATKKSRLEARASCPPFKVRKEKLGDRVAALQQLVAPFGKTDTASVLMEAIGYIKFLQDQVETLSVPYMKASRNKFNRTIKGDEDEESKHDLRSRGLCLVPISCLSYISDGGVAAIWPPPHFGGPT